LSKTSRSFDCFTIVIGAPGNAIDVHFVERVSQSRTFHAVIYHSIEKTNTCVAEKCFGETSEHIYGDEIEDHEMGGARSTHIRGEKYAQNVFPGKRRLKS
jgi:hypothetical protein